MRKLKKKIRYMKMQLQENMNTPSKLISSHCVCECAKFPCINAGRLFAFF